MGDINLLLGFRPWICVLANLAIMLCRQFLPTKWKHRGIVHHLSLSKNHRIRFNCVQSHISRTSLNDLKSYGVCTCFPHHTEDAINNFCHLCPYSDLLECGRGGNPWCRRSPYLDRSLRQGRHVLGGGRKKFDFHGKISFTVVPFVIYWLILMQGYRMSAMCILKWAKKLIYLLYFRSFL